MDREDDVFYDESGQIIETVDDWIANPIPLLVRWPGDPSEVMLVSVSAYDQLFHAIDEHGDLNQCELALANLSGFCLRARVHPSNGDEQPEPEILSGGDFFEPCSEWIPFPQALVDRYHEELAHLAMSPMQATGVVQ